MFAIKRDSSQNLQLIYDIFFGYYTHGLKMQTLSNKSKVRRCLFGPPDHERIRRGLDKALEENNTEMQSKWNFDFQKDSPLEGKFQWEVVEDNSYVPEFYKKGYPVKVKRRITDLNVKLTSGSLSNLSFDSCLDSESCGNTNSVEKSESSSQNSNNKPEKLKQTQISCK